jgi:hypothetical protein
VAAVSVAVAVSVGLLVSQSGGSPNHSGLPSWLPTTTVAVGRVVTATPARPWLAIEGDTVVVKLAHGSSRVTAVGPAVPAEGQFPVPATSPCTFTVTLAKTTGTIPLNPTDFTIIDQLGHVDRPVVTVQGGDPLPSRAPTGRVLTLTLNAVLPTGNGTLRWAPGQGKAVVSWDFSVEID